MFEKIESEGENEKAVEFAGLLMTKGERRSPEETRLLDLLVTRIEDFEEKAYPMGEAIKPADMVRSLMIDHELNQTDMLDIFGSQGAQVPSPQRQTRDQQSPGPKTLGPVSSADRSVYLVQTSCFGYAAQELESSAVSRSVITITQ